jgi:hypothetical protein
VVQKAERASAMNAWEKGKVDGLVKSPSAALRFIPALLNSRYARRRSRFNRVNHCDVRQSTPHSSILRLTA